MRDFRRRFGAFVAVFVFAALAALGQPGAGKVYMVQGPDGPVQAQRPPDSELAKLAALEYVGGERTGYAFELAQKGYLLDAMVDVFGWDYWKTMQARRQYGYAWVPSAAMPNVQIAPGLWMPASGTEDGLTYNPTPPVGAILVPTSFDLDPNYQAPVPVEPPKPPAGSQAIFGPAIDYGDFAGAYYVDPANTVPPGTHADRNGREYVYVVLRAGFTGSLRLWLPVQ
ncbi:MAG TPA: hypothetical protein VMW52_07865 [Phycisphaerae bacterium]|nr:hypothetical protein [Phycisphaerae bacterium]